jgi:prepilin-type N-terminal cleavage/methylation domain-containing protein
MIPYHKSRAGRRPRGLTPCLSGRLQKGFTLVELLVAIAVGSIISLAVIGSIAQLLNGSTRSSNHMAAVRQVQNAGYWVSRDAAMSSSTNTTTGYPDFLIFKWTNWDGVRNQVRYVLEHTAGDLNNLRRIQTVNDNEIGSTLVGQYIYYDGSTSGTYASYPPNSGNMTFTVIATVGTGVKASTERRTYEVKPRPGQ